MSSFVPNLLNRWLKPGRSCANCPDVPQRVRDVDGDGLDEVEMPTGTDQGNKGSDWMPNSARLAQIDDWVVVPVKSGSPNRSAASTSAPSTPSGLSPSTIPFGGSQASSVVRGTSPSAGSASRTVAMPAPAGVWRTAFSGTPSWLPAPRAITPADFPVSRSQSPISRSDSPIPLLTISSTRFEASMTPPSGASSVRSTASTVRFVSPTPRYGATVAGVVPAGSFPGVTPGRSFSSTGSDPTVAAAPAPLPPANWGQVRVFQAATFLAPPVAPAPRSVSRPPPTTPPSRPPWRVGSVSPSSSVSFASRTPPPSHSSLPRSTVSALVQSSPSPSPSPPLRTLYDGRIEIPRRSTSAPPAGGYWPDVGLRSVQRPGQLASAAQVVSPWHATRPTPPSGTLRTNSPTPSAQPVAGQPGTYPRTSSRPSAPPVGTIRTPSTSPYRPTGSVRQMTPGPR